MKLFQPGSRIKTWITIAITLIIGIMLVAMLVQGVQVHEDNNGIKISGGLFYSAKVPYSDIKDIQLVTAIDFGRRNNGAAIGAYKLGNYKNSAYGSYKLFITTDVPKYIVIQYGEKKAVVFNCKSEEATIKKYESLLTKIQ